MSIFTKAATAAMGHPVVEQFDEQQRLTFEYYQKNAHVGFQIAIPEGFHNPWIADFCNELHFTTVLDIGCGPGFASLDFCKLGKVYTGIDFSPLTIECARKLHRGIDFRVMNMTTMTFVTGSFDAFWSSISLVHVPVKQTLQTLEEYHRILKPGGFGALFTDAKSLVSQQYMGDIYGGVYTTWHSGELEALLEQAGFLVIKNWDMYAVIKSVSRTIHVPICCFYVQKKHHQPA